MHITATILFERSIEGGSLSLNDRDRDLLRCQDLDETEIHQFKQSIGHEFQIARFDIAMNNRRLLHVQERKGTCKLVGPGEHIFFWQEGFVESFYNHERPQMLAREVIHNEISERNVGKEIKNFGKVGMIETRK